MWEARESESLSSGHRSYEQQRRYDLWSLCATIAVASAVLLCGLGWSTGLIEATPLTAIYFLGAVVCAFFLFGMALFYISVRQHKI